MSVLTFRTFLLVFVVILNNLNVIESNSNDFGKFLSALQSRNDNLKEKQKSPEAVFERIAGDIYKRSAEADSRDIPVVIKTTSTTSEILLDSLLRLSTTCTWLYLFHKTMMSLVKSIGNYLQQINIDHGNVPTNFTLLLPPNCTLNSYEIEIANSVMYPCNIDMDIKKLGGLRSIKKFLWDCVDDTSNLPDLPKSELTRPVQSILFYGPPGCGKSSLALALSKHLNIPIMHITPSMLLRKWLGDTSQLTKAVFSLALKIKPCVVFIDEMDSLFRTRSDTEHSVDRNVKTEFMQLWDQVISSGARVLVIGATNRPEDLDPAIQRRFERSILLGMPDELARIEILKVILRDTKVHTNMDWAHISRATDGYSPSDLLALCKAAAAIPLRDYRRAIVRLNGKLRRLANLQAAGAEKEQGGAGSGSGNATVAGAVCSTSSMVVNTITSSSIATDSTAVTAGVSEGGSGSSARAANTTLPRPTLRPLLLSDFEEAMQSVLPTSWAAKSYGGSNSQEQSNNGGGWSGEDGSWGWNGDDGSDDDSDD